MVEASYRHEDTFLTLADTADEKRFDVPYRKTFNYDGDFIDDYHRRLGDNVSETGMIKNEIEGWLLVPDAQKIYEMAHFCKGNIIEFGTYKGLSASIMAQATLGTDKEIITIDLDSSHQETARSSLMHAPGGDRVHLFCMDGATAARDQAKAFASYGFAFVDHSHEYEHVYDVCHVLHRVVDLGGFALFHDFNDPRNADRSVKHYGVYQGVMDGLDPRRWEFWGIYGCTGLFRRCGAL